MGWWRLYVALAVLLVLAADVRPQPGHDDVPRYVVFVYADAPSGDCGVPSAVAFSEPQDAYLERNRKAAEVFGQRPSLSTLDAALHYPCVHEITVQLDVYRRMGAVSLERVRELLDQAGLRRVQVVAAPDGIRFAGSTGEVCVAGIYMPKKTAVAAIAPLPDSGRCLA